MLEVVNRERLGRRPGCLCLDLDGTLYPYEPAHAKALEAALDKAGREIGAERAAIAAAFGAARRETKQRLGRTAAGHSRLLYFQAMLEALGAPVHPRLALELEQRYWLTFLEHMEAFAGALEALARLRNAGTRIVLLTDLTSQIQMRKIIRLELENHLDFLVTSEESGADKPAAESFRLATRKSGVPPEETWMLGDDEKADLAGAREAGFAALLFTPEGRKSALADLMFDDYSELGRYLEKLKS